MKILSIHFGTASLVIFFKLQSTTHHLTPTVFEVGACKSELHRY